MPLIQQKFIQRIDVQTNRHALYLFGDNDARRGLGGQAAAMRGEPNAVGIRTKRLPDRTRAAYLSDADEIEARFWWVQDLDQIRRHHFSGGVVVMPLDGIGTGRAELAQRAPKLAEILAYELELIFRPSDSGEE